jgi:hypothetical protein
MKYEQPRRMSRMELEEAFSSGSGERVRDALISAFYTEEPSSVAQWCLKFVSHPEWSARRQAVIVLGNVAVSHREQIDLQKCLEAVERLVADQNEEVRTAAKDAMDDVLHAIRLNSDS